MILPIHFPVNELINAIVSHSPNGKVVIAVLGFNNGQDLKYTVFPVQPASLRSYPLSAGGGEWNSTRRGPRAGAGKGSEERETNPPHHGLNAVVALAS
jgi:hypothetical protein